MFYWDNEDAPLVKENNTKKLAPLISPSTLDLSTLSLENPNDQKVTRKRKMVNDSPLSLVNSTSGGNSLISSIKINEYSRPCQVLKAEDDYFFLDLDHLENNFNIESKEAVKNNAPKPVNRKTVETKAKFKPELFEDLVLVGSEFVPKNQMKFKKRKEEKPENLLTRPRADSGFYDSIKNNLLLAISSISPTSVRKIFEMNEKSSDNINEKVDNETKVEPVQKLFATHKKESSDSEDDLADMIKGYYKSYNDLEKGEKSESKSKTKDEEYKYEERDEEYEAYVESFLNSDLY